MVKYSYWDNIRTMLGVEKGQENGFSETPGEDVFLFWLE
jgi:hypothetical protein